MKLLRSLIAAMAIATAGSAFAAAPKADIVDTAVAVGSFMTLVAAVQAAGLVDSLKGKRPFTVFAPTDAAFSKLPAGTVDALLKDKAKLTKILTYHVMAGKAMAADVKDGKVASVAGGMLTLHRDAAGVTVDGANVTTADIAATNGVIHVIDTVIIPNRVRAGPCVIFAVPSGA